MIVYNVFGLNLYDKFETSIVYEDVKYAPPAM